MIINPKGIDLPIQEMQQLFINNLWPTIDAIDKEHYHRVFKNTRGDDDSVYPGVLKEGYRDYVNVEFDDKLSVLSWFDVSNKTDSYQLGQASQDVGVFFAVNLKKLYPTLDHRAVEEAHLDVQKILLKRPSEFGIEGIITGMEAYGDFETTKLEASDMQPWHVFRFDCKVKYFLTCE